MTLHCDCDQQFRFSNQLIFSKHWNYFTQNYSWYCCESESEQSDSVHMYIRQSVDALQELI